MTPKQQASSEKRQYWADQIQKWQVRIGVKSALDSSFTWKEHITYMQDS